MLLVLFVLLEQALKRAYALRREVDWLTTSRVRRCVRQWGEDMLGDRWAEDAGEADGAVVGEEELAGMPSEVGDLVRAGAGVYPAPADIIRCGSPSLLPSAPRLSSPDAPVCGAAVGSSLTHFLCDSSVCEGCALTAACTPGAGTGGVAPDRGGTQLLSSLWYGGTVPSAAPT